MKKINIHTSRNNMVIKDKDEDIQPKVIVHFETFEKIFLRKIKLCSCQRFNPSEDLHSLFLGSENSFNLLFLFKCRIFL